MPSPLWVRGKGRHHLEGCRLRAGWWQRGVGEGHTDRAAPVLPRVTQAARGGRGGVGQLWHQPKPRQPKVRISLFL